MREYHTKHAKLEDLLIDIASEDWKLFFYVQYICMIFILPRTSRWHLAVDYQVGNVTFSFCVHFDICGPWENRPHHGKIFFPCPNDVTLSSEYIYFLISLFLPFLGENLPLFSLFFKEISLFSPSFFSKSPSFLVRQGREVCFMAY